VNALSGLERREIVVQGIVQGVGFRPFVYALAHEHGIAGSVHNDSQGVYIGVEGPPERLDMFVRDLTERAPPLSVVEDVSWTYSSPRGAAGFQIVESRQGAKAEALISPDMATCPDCIGELFDPGDRRHRYPFINCTNCGPRFTITLSVPYDRASTTMSGFRMCARCQAEYDDPDNRRFHAQPNACRVCGPSVTLLDASGNPTSTPAGEEIRRTAELLNGGAIVAIKGIGGYHLACDPFNESAVLALRERKGRQDKPFALMARDLEQVKSLCRVDEDEAELLAAQARPVVLLPRREPSDVSRAVAPRQQTLGVMLPYAPLHHILLHDARIPLVMTSGNLSEEPIAYHDKSALKSLAGIADFFLVHDRPIHMRCDDSVVRVEPRAATSPLDKGLSYLRRSRGYAPAPTKVAQKFTRHLLATGGQQKNTFCLARDNYAFMSHHIGDLDNYETITSFKEAVDHYCRLFDISPAGVAYDSHPGYLSTQFALGLEEAGLPAVGVQHHHAHIAACVADNDLPDTANVIGVAFDGTGYGTDGSIWGGEFLAGSIASGYARIGNLRPLPMPGGEAAIREPWRMAIAALFETFGQEAAYHLGLPLAESIGERRVHVIGQMISSGVNTPWTSSAGRLFDAVAALIDGDRTGPITYEGQAAIEMESLAGEGDEGGYPFALSETEEKWVVDTLPVVAAVVEDVRSAVPAPVISARFHQTMASIVAGVAVRARDDGGTNGVALSGGVFQNSLLLRLTTAALLEQGFDVFLHRRVPANDGGLALGQAVLGNRFFAEQTG
jgi:hydrogenase maturation protein HypF